MAKTMLAVGLAAATLLVFVVVIAMGGALQAGLAPCMARRRCCRSGGRCVRCVSGAQILGRRGTTCGERRCRRRLWLDKNGVLDGHLVSWPDLRNHPWRSDPRTSCGGSC